MKQVALGLGAFLLAHGVLSASPRYVFSFGDSLTTTGFDPGKTQPSESNPFGNPPYPGITTDNGANWVGVLVQSLSLAGTISYNYAFGSATVDNSICTRSTPQKTIPDMIMQTGYFLDYVAPSSSNVPWNGNNSVFAFWFGSNDILITYNQSNIAQTNELIMQSYFNRLEDVYAAGGRRFLFLSMYKLQRAPVFSVYFTNPDAGRVATDVEDWNWRLNSRTAAFLNSHPDTTAYVLDMGAVYDQVLDNYSDYGYPDNTCTNSDGVSCAWWDIIHPAQAIQAAVAQQVFYALIITGFYS